MRFSCGHFADTRQAPHPRSRIRGPQHPGTRAHTQRLAPTLADGDRRARAWRLASARRVRQARVNGEWGRLHVTFVTYDNMGAYHHTAVLVGPGRLEGMSHALGRGFLAAWGAARADSAGQAGAAR